MRLFTSGANRVNSLVMDTADGSFEPKALFEKWAVELATESAQRGSRTASVYTKMVRLLRNFKDAIDDHVTLRLVPGIGQKTVEQFCHKLKLWCDENNQPFPQAFNIIDKPKTTARKRDDGESDPTKKKRKRTEKVYIPVPRSGGHAVLVALYVLDKHQNGKTKEEIIAVARNYSDSAFTAGNGLHYLAWSSVKTLERHDYVEKLGPRWFLTDKALPIAKQLKESEEAESMDESFLASSPRQATRSTSDMDAVGGNKGRRHGKLEDIAFRVYSPEDLEVVVIVDNREVRSTKERAFFEEELVRAGLKCELRTLPVGDVVWIARHRQLRREAVLNVIAERKRLDDLALSIKDGRYHEQKNRLRRTGMTHFYYLVEEMKNMTVGDGVHKAISSTITLGFFLRRLQSAEDTIAFIADITRIIETGLGDLLVINHPIISQTQYLDLLHQFREKYEGEYEVCHEYSNFQDSLMKLQTTVREIFISMLLAVRGVSYQKAVAIQQRFPTPKLLIEFYRSNQHLPQSEQMMLMSREMSGEISSRKIGAKCLENIYLSWGKLH